MSTQAVVIVTDNPIVLPVMPAGTFSAQATRFRNLDSIGVLIDKFVFRGVPGVPFAVRLSYQGIPVTNGWILVHSFCWPQNEISDSAIAQGSLNIPSVRLAKPLYLGPGEWIDVSFKSQGAPGFPVTCTASAHGRQCQIPPKEKWLPYFTSFMGLARDIDTAAGTFIEVSTPQDLGNPFDNDLYIERLIGRAMMGNINTTGINVLSLGAPGNFFVLGLSDSKDNLWIPNGTPIQNAFNLCDRSWRMNAILPAKQYLRAQIEGVSIGQTAAPANILTPMVGIVGYRRIYG